MLYLDFRKFFDAILDSILISNVGITVGAA